MSEEAREEIGLMQEIDGLFKELEKGDITEEGRDETVVQIRDFLEKYSRKFGKEAGEMIGSYSERLKKYSKKAA